MRIASCAINIFSIICRAATSTLRQTAISLVHGLKDESELLGSAHEAHGVLESEVDDADRVHGVQDGDHRRVAHHLLLLLLQL